MTPPIALTRTDLETIATILAGMLREQLRAEPYMPRISKGAKMHEAMKYARVSRNTLRKWIENGDVYASKRTGEWIVDLDSIDDFYNKDRIK